MMEVSRGLVFLGSKAAGLRICSIVADILPRGMVRAIVCPDDSADPRSVQADFAALASKLDVDFHVVKKSSETAELLRQIRPSMALVHGWYQIIPVDDLPDTTFLGFHYSPLPRYRGSAPLVWQIIAGENCVGVSLFEMVAEMDAGRLYDQRLIPIGITDTVGDALALANEAAESMLTRFADDLVAGTVLLRDQPDEPASYCGVRIAEDGEIDWCRSGDYVHDFIRAQSHPYPGAFTRLPDGRRLTVWGSAREERKFLGAPGAIAEIRAEHVVVTTGIGAVRLLSVQLDGDEVVKAPLVLRSLRTRLGRR